MESLKSANGSALSSTKKTKTSEVRKIWKSVKAHKFLFLLSLIICISGAFLLNRYTTPIYIVQSSILVKESETMNDVGNLMLTKEGYGPPSTYLDKTQEIAILNSYPFIYKTVEALDFRTSYFHQGKIGEVEIYGELPFKLTFPDLTKADRLAYAQYELTFTDKSNVKLARISDKKKGKPFNIKVGEAAVINGCPVVITTTPLFNTQEDLGKNFKVKIHSLKDLAMEYKGNLSVITEEKSSILELQLQTTVPQKGIDFLNECTKQYLKGKYEEKSRSASQALSFINEQINSVKGSLGNTESTIANFKASNTFSDPAEMTNRNLNALSEIENERAALSLNERYYSSMLDNLNNNADLEQLIAPSSVGIQDAMTDNLIKQLADMQIERNSYAASGNSKNPLVQELDIKMNNVKNTLKQNIRTLLGSNRAKLNQLSARAGQFQAKVYSIPLAERRFTDLKRTGDFNDNLYQFLMQKKVEAGIIKASSTVEDKIIEPAFLPSSVPLSPKTTNNYALAVLIGLVLPFSFIRLKTALNKKITDKEEVQRSTSIPVIGSIYHSLESSAFVISPGSRTAISESFRMLRSNITNLTKGQSKKIFLFTSTNSGEGKSFTSINVATSFALANRKTILINLDLRVPSEAYNEITLEANSYNSPSNYNTGITDFLKGSADIQKIIHKTSIPALDYIPTGELPINPAELLMEGNLQKLFEYLKLRYEYVIIDTPPLNLVADPLILANYSDLNVLVVREKYTLKENLSELEQMFQEGKIKDVVMVINDVHLSKRGYKNAYYYKS